MSNFLQPLSDRLFQPSGILVGVFPVVHFPIQKSPCFFFSPVTAEIILIGDVKLRQIQRFDSPQNGYVKLGKQGRKVQMDLVTLTAEVIWHISGIAPDPIEPSL